MSNEVDIAELFSNQSDPAEVKQGFTNLLSIMLGGRCEVSHLKIEAGVLTAAFTMNFREFVEHTHKIRFDDSGGHIGD